MQSKLSVINLLRRSFVLLCTFAAVVCLTGVFTSRSYAQVIPVPGGYQVSGTTSASIAPNGPTSLWATASGSLSWNMPLSIPRQLYFNIDIYIDGVLYSHEQMVVSKTPSAPTVFSVNVPMVFTTPGLHSLRIKGYFKPDYIPTYGYTGHIPLEWDLYEDIEIIVP
jgi:hypothetical protein